jgi:hypothetical protein
LHSGIQIAPEKEEEELNIQVSLNFQSIFEKCHGTKACRNPLFQHKIFKKIDIYDELENFSNLDIAVFNDVTYLIILIIRSKMGEFLATQEQNYLEVLH